jgi:DNA mismatch endonuclease (patch repair protein)
MADSVTKEKRSQIMAAVRSKGNKATEMSLVRIFRRHGIKGWRRHLPLPGRPDFAFRQKRLAIFVDGCFWHGCPKHLRCPKGNRKYWRQKIERNRQRDLFVTRRLRRAGWRVLRVWEHDLKNESRLMARFWKLLSNHTRLIP